MAIDKQQAFAWKLKNDRLWYMKNFLKIRDKQSRLVPLKVNAAQQHFNEIIEEDKKNGKPGRYIILKARQLRVCLLLPKGIFTTTLLRENM